MNAAFRDQVSALVALGEAAFWIGGLILGKEVLGRYKTQLKRFFTCWITKENS